ncbi:ADP-ribosyltransferase [Bacillus cereus]
MSTALFKTSRGNFAKLPILIRLKVPKGTHAAYLGAVAKLVEAELLIHRNASYIINSIEKKTDSPAKPTDSPREYLQIEATLNEKH